MLGVLASTCVAFELSMLGLSDSLSTCNNANDMIVNMGNDVNGVCHQQQQSALKSCRYFSIFLFSFFASHTFFPRPCAHYVPFLSLSPFLRTLLLSLSVCFFLALLSTFLQLSPYISFRSVSYASHIGHHYTSNHMYVIYVRHRKYIVCGIHGNIYIIPKLEFVF